MPRWKDKEQQKGNPEPAWEEGSDNIFKDLGFSGDEAVNLLARADLMIEIRRIIKERGWSQRQAGRELGVAQPRIAEIMGLKTECFSVDSLLKYLDKLGQRVSFVIEAKHDVA
ncbi:MAG TPA: helix-turn-helix transcriptional regulator [Candidatus Obscuribacterales bacterium]